MFYSFSRKVQFVTNSPSNRFFSSFELAKKAAEDAANKSLHDFEMSCEENQKPVSSNMNWEEPHKLAQNISYRDYRGDKITTRIIYWVTSHELEA